MDKCQQMKKAAKISKLQLPAPLWKVNLALIDLSKLPDNLIDEITNNGFELEWIDFPKYLSKINKGRARILNQKKIFHPDAMEHKICRIIEHWQKGEELTPPVVTAIDGYLVPLDGNHRINVAYCYGVTSIPVLIPKARYSDFMNTIK